MALPPSSLINQWWNALSGMPPYAPSRQIEAPSLGTFLSSHQNGLARKLHVHQPVYSPVHHHKPA